MRMEREFEEVKLYDIPLEFENETFHDFLFATLPLMLCYVMGASELELVSCWCKQPLTRRLCFVFIF